MGEDAAKEAAKQGSGVTERVVNTVNNATDPAVWQSVVQKAIEIGSQVVGAILLWIIGRYVINFLVRVITRAMEQQKFDKTLATYVIATVTGLLNIILIVSILGAFGVQTTTFAALFAAIGLAIGTAWSGLLANFAAGVFMVILRPFKVGDEISAGGVEGKVSEIGPFSTTVITEDNVLTIIGNNKVLSENIQNFSHNPYRRVKLTAQLNHDTDVSEVIHLLKERLLQVPFILKEPEPEVAILEFNLAGPKLAVRPFCSNEYYDQVQFATNQIIRDIAVEKGYSVPTQHLAVRQTEAAQGN